MAKYEYIPKMEAFRRVDARGKPLFVNITEAQRIVSLLDLGYSMTDIQSKITLTNPKGTGTTVRSFVKNYLDGNIELPTDAPAPTRVFESMTDNDRLNELEERVSRLEEQYNNVILKNGKKPITEKVKSWLQ